MAHANEDIPLDLQRAAYGYDLPPELIAQQPITPRDAARMLVLRRDGSFVADAQVCDLPDFLPSHSLCVFNDTRVIPARFWAHREDTGGRVEVLLTRPPHARNDGTGSSDAEVDALINTRGRLHEGALLTVRDADAADPAAVIGTLIVCRRQHGATRLQIPGAWLTDDVLERIGVMPLPPYIKRDRGQLAATTAADRERYQTVFARERGAVAAPTASLHFTPDLLARLDVAGHERATVTLHVGLGTFAPVRVDDIREHEMHAERYRVPWTPGATTGTHPDPTAIARRDGRPVIAIGTTTGRVLETLARASASGGSIPPVGDIAETRLFLHPPQTVTAFDALFTNFHTPQSTLMMFVSAFLLDRAGTGGGREALLAGYRDAIAKAYRFFSYGDAMLILPSRQIQSARSARTPPT